MKIKNVKQKKNSRKKSDLSGDFVLKQTHGYLIQKPLTNKLDFFNE